MFNNFRKKLDAIKIIIKSKEFFVIGAYPDLKYNDDEDLAPIKYEYKHNTTREIFYNFCRHYINNI